MQRLEVSVAVRPIYVSLGVKRLTVTGISSDKCRTKSQFLLHDNVPAHHPVLVKVFLGHNNVTTLEHLSNSSDLATAPKGRVFCDVTNIVMNVWVEMKRLTQNSFQECSQQLYSRWQKFIIQQGDYFQRNIA